ncbi:MAG: NAD(P)-dependent oxidoreductase [Lachnospiraceae bacterium]|nr:NAD(P)-dependent oxidoreductase [Lachnospiraceae bacterium]
MKRLLVTGASGFMGSRVVNFYRGKYEICAPGHGALDITDEAQVMGRLRDWRPDYVVHCAAISDVGRCGREPERSWKINVDGAVNLAKASAAAGAKCLLCSSDQVYAGSLRKGPHREDETVNPCNLYGREKLCAEEKCLEANPDCVHLRLSWMYDAATLRQGEHGDFMRTFLEKLRTGEVLRYSTADIRGLTDVNEAAKNLEAAFGLEGGVYNFGSPNTKSMFDTVYSLFVQLGWDTGRLEKEEDTAPKDLTMSQEKLQRGGIFFTDTRERLLTVVRENAPF